MTKTIQVEIQIKSLSCHEPHSPNNVLEFTLRKKAREFHRKVHFEMVHEKTKAPQIGANITDCFCFAAYLELGLGMVFPVESN